MNKTKSNRPFLGAHFSIAGGLENSLLTAKSLGCNALQIFTKNSRTWQEKDLDQSTVNRFLDQKKTSGVDVILSHASYLINIASPDKEKLGKSIHALICEFHRCASLRVNYLVLHPGSFIEDTMDNGMNRAVESLKTVLAQTRPKFPRLLIETTAGQGSNLGSSFEQIAYILEKTGSHSRTGVCLDTSHIFASGYDIREKAAYDQTMSEFDRIVGLDRLYAIHLNDSKTDLGSKKDRHDHIGQGCIGIKAFELIMTDPRLKNTIKIIETPKHQDGTDMDKVNLDRLLRIGYKIT